MLAIYVSEIRRSKEQTFFSSCKWIGKIKYNIYSETVFQPKEVSLDGKLLYQINIISKGKHWSLTEIIFIIINFINCI